MTAFNGQDALARLSSGSRSTRLVPQERPVFTTALATGTFVLLCLMVVGVATVDGLHWGGLLWGVLGVLLPFSYPLLYLPRRGLYASSKHLLVVNTFSLRRFEWERIDGFEMLVQAPRIPGALPLESVAFVVGDKRYPVSVLTRPKDYARRRFSPALEARRAEFARYEEVASQLDVVRTTLSEVGRQRQR